MLSWDLVTCSFMHLEGYANILLMTRGDCSMCLLCVGGSFLVFAVSLMSVLTPFSTI